MTESNHCSICLEPYFQKSLCAIDPCGHIFHHDCFALWQASSGRHGRCKCPECNQISKQYIKLYGISIPERTGGGACSNDENDDDDNDSLSLDSVEEGSLKDTDEDVPDENSKAATEPTTREQNDPCLLPSEGGTSVEQLDVENDDDSVQVLNVSTTVVATANIHPSESEFVDLTETPSPLNGARRTTTPSISSGSSQQSSQQPASKSPRPTIDSSNKKYKRLAKRYKRLYQQKYSTCRELHQQRQALVELHTTTKAEKERLLQEQQDAEELERRFATQLDDLKLQKATLTRQYQTVQDQLQKLREETLQWKGKFQQLQKGYQQELAKAKNSDMAEVQQMMAEHQQLQIENQQLKQEKVRAVEQLSRWRDLMKKQQALQKSTASLMCASSSSSSSTAATTAIHKRHPLPTLADMPFNKKRKASEVAKSLKDMDDQVRYAPPEPTLRPELPGPASRLSQRGRSILQAVHQKSQRKQQLQQQAQQQRNPKAYEQLLKSKKFRGIY